MLCALHHAVCTAVGLDSDSENSADMDDTDSSDEDDGYLDMANFPDRSRLGTEVVSYRHQ